MSFNDFYLCILIIATAGYVISARESIYNKYNDEEYDRMCLQSAVTLLVFIIISLILKVFNG